MLALIDVAKHQERIGSALLRGRVGFLRARDTRYTFVACCRRCNNLAQHIDALLLEVSARRCWTMRDLRSDSTNGRIGLDNRTSRRRHSA